MRKIHHSAWRLVLASAALQILIFPLPDLYWFSWIALAPLLVALLRARIPETLQINAGMRLAPANPWQGFMLAYACGNVWYLGTCYWIFDTMHRYGGIPIPVALLILLAFAMYLGLYQGIFGLLIALLARSKQSPRTVLVLAPFIWVALELARTRITGFPWNLLGYSQTDNASLTRISALTGVYGLSFEIMLVNSVFAGAFLVGRERRKRLLGAAFAAVLILQAGQFLRPAPLTASKTALLVQPNIPVQEDWTTDYFQGTLHDLTWISLHPPGTADAQRYDLIVWPESPSPFFLNDPNYREVIAGLARQSQSWILAGSVGVDIATRSAQRQSDVFNSAALISPAGDLVSRYDKVHLVPFGEYVPFKTALPFMDMLTQQVGEFARGRSREPLPADREKLGLSICYESIFPDEVRQSVQMGADVLVNISNDGWYGDSGAWKQHMQMTQMRAVENNRWLLLATNTGVTATIDPHGRVVASTGRKVRTALAAPYAVASSTTFYTRHGDWFAFACAIISLGALGAAGLNKGSR